MPWVRFLLVLTCAVLCSARAQAAPAPIIFDFEDGLQGWTLSGSAQRVQTQVLGGEWAIFGDGSAEAGALLSIDIDPTELASISVEQFFAGDASTGTDFLFIFLLSLEPPPTEGPSLAAQFFRLTDSPDPTANPGLRTFRLNRSPERPFEGLHRVSIGWGNPLLVCLDGACIPPDAFLGFIDNITFHPVPEPSSWLLLSLGIAGIVMIRRKLASRASS